ncbi:hypothetical protein PVAG01_09431 [Phlyctema vagabunda]|uniref:Uncharacterized protein n=1 Tax=Phlyctema vagabunda TaxID=108571 RepID=A0ABR4P7D1_9HELO
MDEMDMDVGELDVISESPELSPLEHEDAGYESDKSSLFSYSSVEIIVDRRAKSKRKSSRGINAGPAVATLSSSDASDYYIKSPKRPSRDLTIADAQQILDKLVESRPEVWQTIQESPQFRSKSGLNFPSGDPLSVIHIREVLAIVFKKHFLEEYESFNSFLRVARQGLRSPVAAHTPSQQAMNFERQQTRRTSFDLPIVADAQLPVEDAHGMEAAGILNGLDNMTLMQDSSKGARRDAEVEIQELCESMIRSATEAEKQTIVHGYDRADPGVNSSENNHYTSGNQGIPRGGRGFANLSGRHRFPDMTADDGEGDFEQLGRYWNEALVQYFRPLAEQAYRGEADKRREEAATTKAAAPRDEGPGKRRHSMAFSHSTDEVVEGNKKQNRSLFLEIPTPGGSSKAAWDRSSLGHK